jgi:hypothetical protein
LGHDRAKQAEAYRRRITQIYDAERSDLPPDDRVELGPILEREWARGLDEINALLPPVPQSATGGLSSEGTRARQATRTGSRAPRRQTKKAKPKPGRPRQKLNTLEVEAAFEDGRLFIGWSDHPEADRWAIFVRSNGRRIKRLSRHPDALTTTVDDIDPNRGRLSVEVRAKWKARTLAIGSVDVRPPSPS